MPGYTPESSLLDCITLRSLSTSGFRQRCSLILPFQPWDLSGGYEVCMSICEDDPAPSASMILSGQQLRPAGLIPSRAALEQKDNIGRTMGVGMRIHGIRTALSFSLRVAKSVTQMPAGPFDEHVTPFLRLRIGAAMFIGVEPQVFSQEPHVHRVSYAVCALFRVPTAKETRGNEKADSEQDRHTDGQGSVFADVTWPFYRTIAHLLLNSSRGISAGSARLTCPKLTNPPSIECSSTVSPVRRSTTSYRTRTWCSGGIVSFTDSGIIRICDRPGRRDRQEPTGGLTLELDSIRLTWDSIPGRIPCSFMPRILPSLSSPISSQPGRPQEEQDGRRWPRK